MAVKFNTNTGYKHLNVRAKGMADASLRPQVGKMKCSDCSTDTVFTFKQNPAYPGSGGVIWDLDACCPKFDAEIRERLGMR